MEPIVHGAREDLERLVQTHLFVICPNNSGSTFLKNVLAQSRHTWNLKREGPHTFGFVGPKTNELPVSLIWGADPSWTESLSDPTAYDWDATRKAWYFQAFGTAPEASVFVAKAPAFLLIVDQLARAFQDARFLFMVRNPYAAAAGVMRRHTSKYPQFTREELLRLAARHFLTCFERQAANVARYVGLPSGAGLSGIVSSEPSSPDGEAVSSGRGVFFTYEALCAETERVEAAIRGLVPALDDLDLSQRVAVKGMYDEPLRDMNAEQVARLSGDDLAILNDVFRPRTDLLAHFGYTLCNA